MSDRAPRIGIFGGTFDPPHLGHLLVATHARRLLELERVFMVVANDPWQKADQVLAPADARVEMVEALIAGSDGLEVSTLEIDRGGPTYTADTVDAFRARFPEDDLVLILGRDAALGLADWKRADDLASSVTVAVADRPGTTEGDVDHGWTIEELPIPLWDISSSDVRDRLARSAPVDVMIPPLVVSVIERRELYGVVDD